MQMPNRSRGAGLRKRNSEEDCTEIRERNSPRERECVWGGWDNEHHNLGFFKR
jgi:hypothetical protein